MPCGLWYPSSLTRDRTRALAVKAWSPNHWTAREFPTTSVLIPPVFLVFLFFFSLLTSESKARLFISGLSLSNHVEGYKFPSEDHFGHIPLVSIMRIFIIIIIILYRFLVIFKARFSLSQVLQRFPVSRLAVECLFLDWLISRSPMQKSPWLGLCCCWGDAGRSYSPETGAAFVLIPEGLRDNLTRSCEVFVSCPSRLDFLFVQCQGPRAVGCSLWVQPTVDKNPPSIPSESLRLEFRLFCERDGPSFSLALLGISVCSRLSS